MPATKQEEYKVPVSTRALIARINRALRHHGHYGQQLKATRGVRAMLDLGDYYVRDIGRNWIVEKNVNLERLGRELEVLQPWEEWHVED